MVSVPDTECSLYLKPPTIPVKIVGTLLDLSLKSAPLPLDQCWNMIFRSRDAGMGQHWLVGWGGVSHPSLAKPSSFSLKTAHFLLRIITCIQGGLTEHHYRGVPTNYDRDSCNNLQRFLNHLAMLNMISNLDIFVLKKNTITGKSGNR